ncbi:MAG TPA: DUF3006 domain-containing protein [Clostridiales bacterium]|nr:DUF3006 domain-containing protein [Clostridiales bacterium]
MKLIIDRFEGEYAVCENEKRKIINIEKSKLPTAAKEGDTIIKENGEYIIDVDDSKNRKETITNLMDELFD